MKYYVNNKNEIYAYEDYAQPVDVELVEIETPIFNGQVLPQHKALQYDEQGNITNEDVVALIAKEKAENEIATQIADAKAYLTSTDWYYARKLEEGTEVPADVVAKRIELRTLINSL